MKLALVVVALAALLPACSRTAQRGSAVVEAPTQSSPTEAAAGGGAGSTAPAAAAPGAPTGPGGAAATASAGEPVIGVGKAFDNLTVFAVTSKGQEDIGPITTLDDALAKKAAEVREVGAGGGGDPVDPNQQAYASGARVNTLVIENKGDIPIYVLAGTVVKGGQQDRQIGDDFIIGAKQTVPVDAYCVEHGRWTQERNGVPTQGKFGTMQQLVTSPVRAAAQYKRDQAEVWSKVGSVNHAMRKNPASGTLMATLDDGELSQQKAALAGKVNAELSRAPNDDVVGFAYAIDGKVRGVRWFANHKVFDLFRTTLVNTAAVDAITARAEALAAGRPPGPTPPVTREVVTSFIQAAQAVPVKEDRDTPADDRVMFLESNQAYSSQVMLKPSAKANAPSPAGSPPAAPRKPTKVSTDILSK